MSLLAVLAGGYVLPWAPSAPLNPSAYLSIPTPEVPGSNQATHPDVLDFGTAGWNGHRYWMGYTPYTGGLIRYENPCVAYSDDGNTWVEPGVGVNPVATYPGVDGEDDLNYYSDTDLVHDPATGLLWLYWRQQIVNGTAGQEILLASSSADGVEWSEPVTVVTTAKHRMVLSPAVLRVGPGDWRMWTIGYDGGTGENPRHAMRTAPSPTGPWSAPTLLTFQGLTGTTPWHTNVTRDPETGDLFQILTCRPPGQWGLYALRSSDGVTWKTNPNPVLLGRAGGWDENPYRATMTLTADGENYDVWYGATNGAQNTWRMGRFQVSRRAWTTIR